MQNSIKKVIPYSNAKNLIFPLALLIEARYDKRASMERIKYGNF
jgi:hypothetical protein